MGRDRGACLTHYMLEYDLRKCVLITCIMKMSIAKNELVAIPKKIAGVLTIAWASMKPVPPNNQHYMIISTMHTHWFSDCCEPIQLDNVGVCKLSHDGSFLEQLHLLWLLLEDFDCHFNLTRSQPDALLYLTKLSFTQFTLEAKHISIGNLGCTHCCTHHTACRNNSTSFSAHLQYSYFHTYTMDFRGISQYFLCQRWL